MLIFQFGLGGERSSKNLLMAGHMVERKKMNKVIVIDDDKELCLLMKKCVEQENYIAMIADSGAEEIGRAHV